jgi:uncharacterized protein YciI
MKYFFYKLNPPRPTFPADITPDEGKLMQAHSAYWSEQMTKGRVVAIGPVADPKGTYGVGLIRLKDDADPSFLVANDPAILAKAGFTTEVYPMPRLMVAAPQ